MPLRRRRNGAPVRARTEGIPLRSRKDSVAAEGTPILPTASPFARRHPRWISASASRRGALQAPRRAAPATRVPEAPTRRACATSSNSAPMPSLERLGPRLAPSTQVERGGASPRVRVVARRSSTRQRVAGPTQPASVGAGEQRGDSPTRVRGSTARRVCPRVVLRLQKSASDTETHKKRGPLATDA
jgi:hypothetical protein